MSLCVERLLQDCYVTKNVLQRACYKSLQITTTELPCSVSPQERAGVVNRGGTRGGLGGYNPPSEHANPRRKVKNDSFGYFCIYSTLCNTKCYMQADSNAFPTHKHRRTHSKQKYCDYMSLRYG